MAAVAPSSDQASDLLKKLSLDSQKKPVEVQETKKKTDATDVGNAPNPSFERSTTPTPQDFMDPNLCYLPNGYPSTTYYYGGEWDDYSRYMNPEGLEMPPPGVYGDNGSMLYHPGYGYNTYPAYPPGGSSIQTMGPDGHIYGPQHYQYAPQYYQQPNPSNGLYTPPNPILSSQGEVSTSIAPDQTALPVESANAKANGIANGIANGHANGNANGNHGPASTRPNNQPAAVNSNGSYGSRGILPGGAPPSAYQDPRFSFDSMRPAAWLDGPVYPDSQPRPATSSPLSSSVSHLGPRPASRNQNIQPLPHLMGLHAPRPASGMAPNFMNRMFVNSRLYNGGAPLRTGLGYGANNGRGWYPMDNKYKPRGRGNGLYGYGNENMDAHALNEQYRGPRAARFKNQRGSVPSNVTIAVKGQNIPLNGKTEDSAACPDKGQYNRSDFNIKHPDAKFFVIKSYSEDDIHKSIKYSVWASTPNGNKKLDAAYQEAKEKENPCPIFLFFSVNTSGQFCGLAEMVGPVDFNKNLDYWQQDKWNGCFPVKWHIVKDVPNGLLKHITLENNDNKPVTNSRDSQEVKLEQGVEMLKIFKEHVSKISILDDFWFYEDRQKQMQESRAKIQHAKQVNKQSWDGKANGVVGEEKDGVKPKLQKSADLNSAAVHKDTTIQDAGDRKQPEENGTVGAAGDIPKASKPVAEKRVNGIANGC